jgi:hypothetical protein
MSEYVDHSPVAKEPTTYIVSPCFLAISSIMPRKNSAIGTISRCFCYSDVEKARIYWEST